MLVRFGVENYKSFRDMTYLDMVSGTQTKMKNYIIENKYNKVLNFIAMYGANASGKSNLVDAMYLSRNMILRGTNKLSTVNKTFRCTDNDKINSTFSYHLVIDDKYYVYNISVNMNSKEFEFEELYCFDDNENDYKPIYIRTNNSIDIKYSYFLNIEERIDIYLNDFTNNKTFKYFTFLEELSKKDLKNTNAKFIIELYDWFKKLAIIKDDNHYSRESLLDYSCKEDNPFLRLQGEFLHDLDTGIDEIDMVSVSMDELEKLESKYFIDSSISEVQKETDDKDIYIRRSYTTENVYAFVKEDDKIIVKKMIYKHNNEEFDFIEESTGTKKLIDLFTILFSFDRTVVIDEIDRSFHHNLTVEFIKKFMKISNNTQLIVTTHDPLLMDLKLFRRDSFWFVERAVDNSSKLFPLESFKPRFDKVLYKDYLDGRYNAVPCLNEDAND